LLRCLGEIGIGATLGVPFLLATLAMFVTGAAAVVYRKRREQGMEIRCREASVGDEFPWCKTPGKDVIVDQRTIARDVGFFLVFFAVAVGVGIVDLPPLA
jgi:cation:H+ antiporter